MTEPGLRPPVTGLQGLSTESRVIATPWSRMVRGLGLGQYPIDYDPVAATRIRRSFDLIETKLGGVLGHPGFSSLLARLILDVVDPAADRSLDDVRRQLGPIVEALRSEPNPYRRVMCGCILMDAFARLGLDAALLARGGRDLPGDILAVVDAIEDDRIEDENKGLHGAYERLSAATAVFLAFGALGLENRLVEGGRDRVAEALCLVDAVPAPFFRGRGGSMLLSAAFLLGRHDLVRNGERDYVCAVLDHLDRADALNLEPSFPQPMSRAFSRFYPLVTMLNAIAMSGRSQYLAHGQDRLAEAGDLWSRLAPIERTHMGLYYIVALHNLGRLTDQIPDLDRFVSDIVARWTHIDPGANFFLNGIAYAYMIETAMLTGRTVLVTDALLDRLVDSFPDLDRTDLDRINRPYPASYVLNALGEIGEADRLFMPRARYGGGAALDWVIDSLPPGGGEGDRLYMMGNALVSYALRLRGKDKAEPRPFAAFHFPFDGSSAPMTVETASVRGGGGGNRDNR